MDCPVGCFPSGSQIVSGVLLDDSRELELCARPTVGGVVGAPFGSASTHNSEC